MRRFHTRTIVAASVLAASPPAFAQQSTETQADGVDVIVVTARRREESLLDVPVAVTALSSRALDRAHITDLQQIAQMTPNLLVGHAGGGGGGTISIRGIGTSFLDPGIEQSVGLNLDGVSVGRGRFIDAGQFDLQQVEVLKGPQALFFGKNSPAGVISITTANPTVDFSAMARVGYEFEADERYAEGYVSGPISDNLLFRVAGKYSDYKGWIKIVGTSGPNLVSPGYPIPYRNHERGPAQTNIGGRLTLKWTPTTDFTATLKAFAFHNEGDGEEANTEGYCTPTAATYPNQVVRSFTLGTFVVDPNSDCFLDRRKAFGALPTAFRAGWRAAQKNDGRSWNNLDMYFGSLNMAYQAGGVSLTSVTGYTKVNGSALGAYSVVFYTPTWSQVTENARTISQELRLNSNFDGPLNFTLGGFVEDSKRTNGFTTLLGFVGFDANNGGSVYTFATGWRNSGSTYSGYGQLRWSILESLELAGGVRYTKERKRTSGGTLYRNTLGTAFGLAPAGTVIRDSLGFSNWSPEITLAYKPTDQVMVYAAYKTGYKSGGLSTPATATPAYVANPSLLSFAPERSKGFEAGIKGEFLHPSLRFDVTAYRYQFSGLQLTTYNNDLAAYFVKNAGRARTTGVEGSLTWRATPELTFDLAAAYNKAKFISFKNAQCYREIFGTPVCPLGAAGFYDRSGQPLPRAPKFTFSASGHYERDITQDLKLGLSGEAIYTGSYWTSETGSPFAIQDSYWRLNASVSLGAVDDSWEVALIGRNLTDEYVRLITVEAGSSQAGHYGAYTVRPREIALQGTVRF